MWQRLHEVASDSADISDDDSVLFCHENQLFLISTSTASASTSVKSFGW
jgi:hypothetical protein